MRLPIDQLLPDIVNTLQTASSLVIEAPPGAGKTTRVPWALLPLGGVIVLEPRRLAARMAARRVAAEIGEPLGETVGYQVRFEDISSARTRLRFLTEGILTRRLVSDPELAGVKVAILDEFHERHIDGDVALALLRRLQQTRRPDLKIVVMSATLDGGSVAAYLGNCPVLRSEGRLHPIHIEHTLHSNAALEDQVAAAADRLLATPSTGDILVFLPGAAEIRRAQRALEPLAQRKSVDLFPLHGDLSPEEQDRAVTPGPRPKIILSTNVAESSLTIEGVTAVIDSGLVRQARDNAHTGLTSLEVTRVAKANATQRAGRAGRTAPGRVIRLYPVEDFTRRPEAEVPEIRRRELSPLLLDLHAMGIEPASVPWYEPPPEPALEAAQSLLERLNAFPRARQLTRLPVHPRLGTLLLECPSHDACMLAAALSAGERAANGNVFSLLEINPSYQSKRLAEQLRRLLRADPRLNDDHLRRAILRAYPDRVVRAHTVSTPLTNTPLLIALDREQRRDSDLPIVRLAMPLDPELLVDVFPERVTERVTVEWNRSAERVEAASALLYEDIVIEETRSGKVDLDAASRLLAEKAAEAGIERFTDPDDWNRLLARCQFAAAHSNLPTPDPNQALIAAATGLRSFADLRQANLPAALLAQFTPDQRKRLDTIAPDRLTLPSGRSTRVEYSKDKEPWIASRLQDFFGWHDTPRIAAGAVPLTLHLLAPSQRPVQTTRDLAGFWARLYPQVRRELMRRYPKHRWPEDPATL